MIWMKYFSAFTLLVAIAFAQTSVTTSATAAGFSGSAGFGPPPFAGMAALTGAPYSAEEVNEQIQTLADGTHITRKSASTRTWRDSAGRTRIERPLFGGPLMAGRLPDSPQVVEITDPVAQLKYTLDTVNKVAHRQQFQAPRVAAPGLAVRTGVIRSAVAVRNSAVEGGAIGAGVFAPAAAAAVAFSTAAPTDAARPETTTENLGTRTIEGVAAQGTRRTITWPIDSQGNDRPIAVVTETWTSPELKLTILNRSDDPRTGENIRKMTNISLSEPSGSLFQVPGDYTIVDEAGEFTIQWGSKQ